MKYKFGKAEYDLSSRTFVMGILNITPDSFSDGGKYFNKQADIKKAVEDAVQMEKDGADFIDVGGESTRPGSEKVELDKELERVIPLISLLTKKINIPVSIDTYKHEVADEALKAGATIVNDISGFKFDKKIAEVTAKHNASCILMHIKGTPKDMQLNPVYENVVEEVYEYLNESVETARNHGIRQIITDVGIGFGKSLDHNLELLRNLKRFQDLKHPVLLGVSRKSFIDKIFPAKSFERLEGTIAANILGIVNGANIIRVHDVKENKKAVRIADRILYKK
ncbi:MAG TPA: dihydropteroate synthase [Ignavibacteria bacterium]|nr:dihydropteroate synthase [Ignavibacteria bacterium]